jgi:hypothetical protein
MKRLSAMLFLACCASTAAAQGTDPPPLYVFTADMNCWFDGLSRYRITYTEHHLGFNQTTGLYYVAVGCDGQEFGIGTDQAIRTYTASISADPCVQVDEVSFFADNSNAYETGCGSWQPQVVIQLGPTAINDLPGVGIQLPPQGAVGGTGITYTVEWQTDYHYQVKAIATGPNAGGTEVIVEQGQLLTKATGRNCFECGGQIPDDPDPPPPPPPPPPVPPNNGGGGPNGETGPDFPGGPDNPEGPVCCQFADGTNQEMSYQQCADQGGEFWYPAPCNEPIGCCSFLDPSTGEFMSAPATQAECVVLEGTWSPDPCEDDCADCCEAIRALLEDFTDDVQQPLRDWLLEDWPDFSTRVLAVLEEPGNGTPDLEGVEAGDVEAAVGDADNYFDAVTVPNDSTGSTAWEFDVLGESAQFDISLDPRNWPDDAMHNTLASFILAMRLALSIGLTIMFGSLVGRVLRQW